MTVTSKIDITKPDERGLVIGLNEFSGCVGVAIAGILTRYPAGWFDPRTTLLIFGLVKSFLRLLFSPKRRFRANPEHPYQPVNRTEIM